MPTNVTDLLAHLRDILVIANSSVQTCYSADQLLSCNDSQESPHLCKSSLQEMALIMECHIEVRANFCSVVLR